MSPTSLTELFFPDTTEEFRRPIDLLSKFGLTVRRRFHREIEHELADAATILYTYQKRFGEPPFSQPFDPEEIWQKLMHELKIPESNSLLITVHDALNDVFGFAWQYAAEIERIVENMLIFAPEIPPVNAINMEGRIREHLQTRGLPPHCTFFSEIAIIEDHPKAKFGPALLIKSLAMHGIGTNHPTYLGYTHPDSNLFSFISKRGGEVVFPFSIYNPESPFVMMAGDYNKLAERLK